MASNFIILDSLPQKANGKLDVRALPAPDCNRPLLDDPFVPPRTPIEQTLAEIWSEILIIRSVGIHDKFLELGGNSIMATQIITRVLNKFQVKLSMQSLLTAPTIADMASLITKNLSQKVNQGELEKILADMEKLSEKEAEELAKLI